MYKVILIDDEPWARKVVKKLGKFDELELEIVGEAEDGNAGIELIERERPDIVITDMRMPGMDGVGLMKAIRDQYQDVMLIVMSGYNDFIYLKQAIRSEVIEYLLKPLNPLELNQALKRSIEKLNQRNKHTLDGYGTLHLFQEEKELEAYVHYRQSIERALLAHDQQNIKEHFQRMEDRFGSSKDLLYRETASKVIHDFIQMLEEFVVHQGIPIDEVFTGIKKQEDRVEPDQIFGYLSELYLNVMSNVGLHRKEAGKLQSEKIKAYIDQHAVESISLEEVAAAFYVSKSHLSRVFKQSMNQTINDYILSVRMNQAKELLEDKSLAIKDIAALTGYQDIAYFYRVFKKYHGLAPGEYREQI